MAYSLGVRCAAEFLGMMVVIYTGEAALANELLPSTKGHGMGWGWTVFTFGFAFFAPLQIFAKVSAKLNPAMVLAQWVWGNLTGVDFVCLSLAELAGAFVGGVLVWLHYLPHFKTLPEPPASGRDEDLLRRRDHLRESALAIASYATRPDRKVTRNPLSPLRHTFYYLRAGDVIHEETPEQVLAEYYHHADPIARRASLTAASGREPQLQPLARRTIQVADLQRHLEEKHVETVLAQRTCPKCSGSDSGLRHRHLHEHDQNPSSVQQQQHASSSGNGGTDAGLQAGAPPPDSADGAERLVLDMTGDASKGRSRDLAAVFGSEEVAAQKRRAQALYQAAVEADQNAKLSIFACRPAIHSPLYNFITELMGTIALITLAMLIELQARRFPEGEIKLFYEVGLQNLLLCFMIVTLISGLGGPTAYAANPARDLGPRLAHAVLPIPGKGPSEWSYAWIPVVAPLVGGAISGALYIAIEEMQFPGGGPRGGGLFVG